MSSFVITGHRGELASQMIPLLRATNTDVHLWSDIESQVPKGAVVLHFAAKHPGSRVEELLRSNLSFLKTVLDESKGKASRFIFISSSSIYGKSAQGNIDEQYDGSELDDYGMTKVLGEKIALESGLPCLILRCPAILELSECRNLLSKMYCKLDSNSDLHLFNSHVSFNSYIDAQSVWEAISAFCELKNTSSLQCNIAVKNSMSLADTAQFIHEQLSSSSKIFNQLSNNCAYTLETNLIESRLGFNPPEPKVILERWIMDRKRKTIRD